MLAATFSYDAATNTVTATDLDETAPFYRLLRRQTGKPDEVLPLVEDEVLAKWKPTADGCPFLVLQSGDMEEDPDQSENLVFVPLDESEPYPLLLDQRHTDAIADNYDKYAQQHPKGHPLDDVLQVVSRRDEGRYLYAENNPLAADKLLTRTKFPR